MSGVFLANAKVVVQSRFFFSCLNFRRSTSSISAIKKGLGRDPKGRPEPQIYTSPRSREGRQSSLRSERFTPSNRPHRFWDREQGTERISEAASLSRGEAIDSPRRRRALPLSIPHTTAASEFLYGTSVVTEALKSRRRTPYVLYVYDGQNRTDTAQRRHAETLAQVRGVAVEKLSAPGLMDKMSKGRPHNVGGGHSFSPKGKSLG